MTTKLPFPLVICILCGCLNCDALQDVRDALDEPIVQEAVNDSLNDDAEFSLIGVSAAHDFQQTGNVQVDLAPEEQSAARTLNSLVGEPLRVEVENADGSHSDCEYVGGETRDPAARHTAALLLDGSGSMELSYPPDEHGDTCLTCPHDPNRERITAAHAFIHTVLHNAPETPIAVAEFGPQPSAGFSATRLHSDFDNDLDTLDQALDRVEGYEPVGTPLFDALAEMIEETNAVADPMADAGQYVVVLSDGEDNASTHHDVDSVVSLAQQLGVRVYAVGLGPASAVHAGEIVDPEQSVAIRNLQAIATQTGGIYAAANDSGQLRELYSSIARAVTLGHRVDTYACVPGETQQTPRDARIIPPTGTPVHGRAHMGDLAIPWVAIAN